MIYIYLYIYTHTCVHIHNIHIHNGILLGSKNEEILPFAYNRYALEGIMLSEVNRDEKDRYC